MAQFNQSTGGVLMRRTLIGFIAAAALGSVSPAAFAADMVPEPAPVSTWTGFYLGAGGGVGWADVDVNHRRCLLDEEGFCDPENDFHHDFNENTDGNIIGIVQGGFDYEIAPSFVIGVGADATFGDILNNDRNHNDSDFEGLHTRFETDGSTMVDVYGRVGFAPIQGSLLIYALGGWSWLDADTSFRVRDDEDNVLFHNDDNVTANGFTVGGGLEWKFTDSLSIRGEYRFTDLEDFDLNGNFFDHCGCDNFHDRNNFDVNVQRVLFTLNWRFGGFGATTAAAY
jgi:outer membrane immunogenic protein